MPVIAHMICQNCGAQCEAAVRSRPGSATFCPCGGMRQVVRVVRHPDVEASASSVALERNVQARATDESLTP
jgi:coenzyme F420-reducing hydrogenase beta subunit